MSDMVKVPAQARLKSSGYSIGDLARMTGVRPSAIRYYESCQLLPPPVRRSGKRQYDRDAVARLKSIIDARTLGFTIRELRELSAMNLPAQRAVALKRAAALRAKISELFETANRLEELSGCDCTDGNPCRL